MDRITILAGVVPYFCIERTLKVAYKKLLQRYTGYIPHAWELSKYGGHYGVSRSMVEGLKKAGCSNLNYNPFWKSQVGETVIVIASIKALRQAINWKRSGKIKKLIAGPNLCVLPTDYPEISAPEIDVYITHSDWCIDYFEDLCPALKGKMRKWAAGVDEDFWNPDQLPFKSGNKLLFYKKRPEKHLYETCRIIAQRYGFEVIELIPGTYNLKQYKQVLAQVDFLVHFVEQESQGISLSEAWSMNVPCFAWNPGNWSYNLLNIKCSSAPWMNEKNGRFFRDESEFEQLFVENQLNPDLYSSRQWLKNTLSDKKSGEMLMQVIDGINE